jgi:hypothetical protein
MTDGLSIGDDCAFVRPFGSADRAILDLAHDPSGTRIVAVEGEISGRSRLFLSEDGGRRFEAPPGAAIDGAFTTVDFAPSDARVLYAAARSPRGTPDALPLGRWRSHAPRGRRGLSRRRRRVPRGGGSE